MIKLSQQIPFEDDDYKPKVPQKAERILPQDTSSKGKPTGQKEEDLLEALAVSRKQLFDQQELTDELRKQIADLMQLTEDQEKTIGDLIATLKVSS